MAKKATSRGSGGTAKKSSGTKAKAAAGKPRPRKSAEAADDRKKPAAKSSGKGKAQQQQEQAGKKHGAADAVVKLLESPLAVDLIAVGATAALAAIAEQRFGRRDDDENANSAVKAAGKAAAAAMGRRIATEVDQILKASKEARGDEEA